VKAKESVIVIVQHTPADQAKIGKVFFTLARKSSPAIAAAAELQGNRAGVRSFGDELPETVETGAKNRAEYAIAWRFPSIMDQAHTEALAVRA
jgi:hypothetical protein